MIKSLNKEIRLYKTRDSPAVLLVDIATVVRAENQRNRGLFSGSGNRFFCSQQLLDTSCGPRSLLFNWQRTLFPREQIRHFLKRKGQARVELYPHSQCAFMAYTGKTFYSITFRNDFSNSPLCYICIHIYTYIYIYRVIYKSLRNFRTRLRNNQEKHGRKEHINR